MNKYTAVLFELLLIVCGTIITAVVIRCCVAFIRYLDRRRFSDDRPNSDVNSMNSSSSQYYTSNSDVNSMNSSSSQYYTSDSDIPCLSVSAPPPPSYDESTQAQYYPIHCLPEYNDIRQGKCLPDTSL